MLATLREASRQNEEKGSAMLSPLPKTVEVTDEAAWAAWMESTSESDYGRAIVAYTKAWARLMQQRINDGEQLENIAEHTSRIADPPGPNEMTLLMHGTAVEALVLHWKYGEQLRKWHNAQYGMGEDFEGIVNPGIAGTL